MTKRIEDLLHRRNDLSTFLVHLSRDHVDRPARENLLDILVGGVVEAGRPMGLGGSYWSLDAEFAATQKMVCFTETPLEHVWMMCEDIEGRSVQLKPYGVAFTKAWARRRGVNPVMYVDITTGHNWLTNAFNLMLDAAAAGKAVIKGASGSRRWSPSPTPATTPPERSSAAEPPRRPRLAVLW